MRKSSSLLILTAWAVVRIAQGQTPAPQPAESHQAASQPAPRAAAARPAGGKAAHPARAAGARHSRARRATETVHARAPAAKGEGVLALGATDITGNKELPKVMVIVPWKSSSGADGVIKPADSLLDEVLGPVDRGVFQRRIRYYGQLNAAGEPPVPGRVAPVGDRR